ncbi:hypothetical protein B4U80_13615 [Leptotrombidium deliense]|uniref:RING-type domain-containing protein n=1 Tax=Leptotrombidium deliense TaxID=299467 RepID=A0A443SSZ8_9ACAR|nr:hypothetical protein B4U80_13615 [Leptotrombidium deliense]
MNNIASVVVMVVAAVGGALVAYYVHRNRTQEQSYVSRPSRRRRSPNPDIVCSSAECIICKEDFRSGGVEILPCGHMFHALCIKEWFGVRFNCPSCRDEIPSHMIPEFRSRLNIEH